MNADHLGLGSDYLSFFILIELIIYVQRKTNM